MVPPNLMEYVAKHGLSDLDRVRSVIDHAYDAYRKRLADYHPSMKWVDERHATVSFRALGKTIEAKFAVTDEEVRVNGDIPFVFRPFQGKIERVIGQEVEKWLAKARAGEIERRSNAVVTGHEDVGRDPAFGRDRVAVADLARSTVGVGLAAHGAEGLGGDRLADAVDAVGIDLAGSAVRRVVPLGSTGVDCPAARALEPRGTVERAGAGLPVLGGPARRTGPRDVVRTNVDIAAQSVAAALNRRAFVALPGIVVGRPGSTSHAEGRRDHRDEPNPSSSHVRANGGGRASFHTVDGHDEGAR